MAWLQKTVGSSVGGKFVVAVTGLLLVLFLVAHLAGNLLVFKGPDALAAYAQQLHSLGPVVWIVRIGLLVVAVGHVALALKLNLANRAARPIPYAKKIYLRASVASRSMLPTGLVLLAFIVFHLADFTLRITRHEYQALGPYDVYPMLIAGFSNPLHAGFYIIAMIALGFHLNHGLSSVFQTLGLRHPKYDPLIGLIGPLLGSFLALGFLSIPLSVMLGFVK